MGLLQIAYQTYENHIKKVGKIEEGKETLTPISHMIQNAQIEIVISNNGVFQKAKAIEKNDARTIIPATINSSNRVGDNTNSHPLSDQLRYITYLGGEKFRCYLSQITLWAESPFSHPKVKAVLNYIKSETIIDDLLMAGIISLDENGKLSGKINNTEYEKCLVRWIVIPAPEGVKSACWEDETLFQSFISFYKDQCNQLERDICLITGEEDILCEMHPKGIIQSNFGAKLISANDSSGFTYRGRFVQPKEASSVGYLASQKAHSALRWIAVNQGIIMGGRTFLCWNPEGNQVPTKALFGMPDENITEPIYYKKQILETISGYKKTLKSTDDIVIAALDAATTGRLSVTYYSEMKASDFFNYIENWYETCCFKSIFGKEQSPSLKQIILYAFGIQRDKFMEIDEKVLREHVQRILHCVIGKQKIPFDIVQALATKANNLQIYTPENRERLLITTCAIIRKYRNDKKQKEEWNLSLDNSNVDRSYLFGRLLAIAEQVERRTYDRDESRETNAIRMQLTFSQRPLYAWRIINENLIPYFARLSPGTRAYYKNLIGKIMDSFPDAGNSELAKKLDDTYLLGYYHQRSALIPKKKTVEIIEMEEIENEYSEK